MLLLFGASTRSARSAAGEVGALARMELARSGAKSLSARRHVESHAVDSKINGAQWCRGDALLPPRCGDGKYLAAVALL